MELAEKNKLIKLLTEGNRLGIRAARECQILQAENDRLRGQLAGRRAELSAEVGLPSSEASAAGDCGVQLATA